MVKLRIKNAFQGFSEEDLAVLKMDARNGCCSCPTNPYNLKPYDEEKYKDGRMYEFNTLKDLNTFYEQAQKDIDWKEDHARTFGEWSWQELDFDLYIDDSEDNLMVLSISAHDEWRD